LSLGPVATARGSDSTFNFKLTHYRALT
jgi:hypothetical protein